MGDKKADTGPAKKAIEKEVKALGAKVKKDQSKIKKLCEEKKEIEQKKKQSPDDKKKLKALKVDWEKIASGHQSEADRIAANIQKALKEYKPDDDKQIEAWKKDLAPWYLRILEKEPGLDLKKIGIPGRATGELSLEKGKEKVYIQLNFEF